MTLFFKYHAFFLHFSSFFPVWALHTLLSFLFLGPFSAMYFCFVSCFVLSPPLFIMYSIFCFFSSSSISFFPPSVYSLQNRVFLKARVFTPSISSFVLPRSFFYTTRIIFYHAYIVFLSNFTTPHFRFCPFRHNPSFGCPLFFFLSPTIIFVLLFLPHNRRLRSSRRVSSYVLFCEVGEVVSPTFVIS